jgi:NADH:ubiquinone oxidoreductase subunit 6 (subunit J)
MDRLRRDHSREFVGAALVVIALVAIVVGYANIKDEAEVAIQLPYILTGGIGALVLTAVGVAVLRSQDDKAILDRLADVESIGYDLRERVVYLNQLLEAGLLPDESAEVAKK